LLFCCLQIADFVTTPLGVLQFTDGGGPETMKGDLGKPGRPDVDDSHLNSTTYIHKSVSTTKAPMRILSLTISMDPSVDASTIVSPVVAVFDHGSVSYYNTVNSSLKVDND